MARAAQILDEGLAAGDARAVDREGEARRVEAPHRAHEQVESLVRQPGAGEEQSERVARAALAEGPGDQRLDGPRCAGQPGVGDGDPPREEGPLCLVARRDGVRRREQQVDRVEATRHEVEAGARHATTAEIREALLAARPLVGAGAASAVAIEQVEPLAQVPSVVQRQDRGEAAPTRDLDQVRREHHGVLEVHDLGPGLVEEAAEGRVEDVVVPRRGEVGDRTRGCAHTPDRYRAVGLATRMRIAGVGPGEDGDRVAALGECMGLLPRHQLDTG